MSNAPAIIIPRKRILRTRHQRRIVMPFGMEPEWLAPQYRDHYITRCLAALERMIGCEKCRKRRLYLKQLMKNIKLRKFQRGNFHMFPAGTTAILDANCSYTASTIPNLSDFNLGAGTAYTLARLHSDGDWYWTEGSAGFGASRGTWQGGCAVADYDTKWTNNTGGAPSIPNYSVSGTDDTWAAATTSKAVGYSASGFASKFGNFTMSCRDGTTLATLFTDSFDMTCDSEL